jgi:SAM-dependent methyltransferase
MIRRIDLACVDFIFSVSFVVRGHDGYKRSIEDFMTEQMTRKDRHFPVFIFNNFIRRLFENPKRHNVYVEQGHVVADLGCGPGFFTFPLAEGVGSQGKVFAVDSDEKAIRVVKKIATRKNHDNIDAHTSSAAQLRFIGDESVDFVLADGLICCMALQDHAAAVSEIKRILKHGGKAFIMTTTGAISYVDDQEWESILGEFAVEERNHAPYRLNRWAVVSKNGLS